MKRIFLLLMLVLVIVNIQSNMMRASAEETPPMLTMLASESEKRNLIVACKYTTGRPEA